jgi:hypothetical protein
MVRLDLRDRAGEKIKDGRHVGLDFYDLLIEVSEEAAETFSTADATPPTRRKRSRGGKEQNVALALVVTFRLAECGRGEAKPRR